MIDQDSIQFKLKSHHYLIAFITGVLSLLIALVTTLSFWSWIIIWVISGVLIDKLLRTRR